MDTPTSPGQGTVLAGRRPSPGDDNDLQSIVGRQPSMPIPPHHHDRGAGSGQSPNNSGGGSLSTPKMKMINPDITAKLCKAVFRGEKVPEVIDQRDKDYQKFKQHLMEKKNLPNGHTAIPRHSHQMSNVKH
ncbi:hypothetical protein FGSG_11711 [Fusarium graminearum PH-1]|uniref:Chromosome 1, complete genome n=1 Tax=Gibberella zeae (strain ATCC MYA-4620 / CBS 123657 / FGSC 9075 / NRRL 31084 / PH-1) TaxID=229533 RepID=I1S4E4_GIBZE|nr:hypothetical protein FGSG_11711 [Fusarium graminearum PH-1]ESU05346.1 hypothetical protein FGSG_11711 [Fusarium graminearum PH-1]CAF3556144.1 unnamed protein product [Fusarium graminearum]CEF72083.1 unnamed protein product [Fusarium graminearum]|eukprot:XP_011315831.1 hypothetical protein FGSG_11711 [Fusarium graminearum PH-1]